IGSAPITIPAGETDLVVARWTAATSCGAPPSTFQRCDVQLTANQTSMLPADVFDVFDQAPYGSTSLTAHRSIERFSCLSGGTTGTTYRINVQAKVEEAFG